MGKSIVFGTLKFMTYAVVSYIFIAPMQRFIAWMIAHVLLGLWWVGFAQWISLLCRSQVTAVMILLLVPIFEGLFSGHYFFSMLWSAEIDRYPDHVAIIPIVNQTNYWYNIESDKISKSGITAVTNKTYTGNLFQYTGGMEPWVSDMLSMLWLNLVIRIFGLVCLAFMASSTNRWVSDKNCARESFPLFLLR